MKTMNLFIISAIILSIFGHPAFTQTHAEALPLATKLDIKKIMVIIFENTTQDEALKQTFFKRLAKQGAFLANSFGVTHPSYPNYIALISGDTFGITKDKQVSINENNLSDLLEAKHKTWKVYAEDYPKNSSGNCFLGSSSGDYVRRHIPFLSFRNIQDSPERCENIVNAQELENDIKQGFPNFSLYIPNNKNNGHDTGVAYANRWFEKKFGPLLERKEFTDGLLLIVTFDEDDYQNGNKIYTVLWGNSVRPGTVSNETYNHYNILRTIEDLFGLGTLKRNDEKSSRISGIWK